MALTSTCQVMSVGDPGQSKGWPTVDGGIKTNMHQKRKKESEVVH